MDRPPAGRRGPDGSLLCYRRAREGTTPKALPPMRRLLPVAALLTLSAVSPAPALGADAAGPARPNPTSPRRTPDRHRLLKAQTRFCVALGLELKGQFGAAIQAYAQVIKLDPTALPPRQRIALLADRLGRTGDAILYYHALIKIDPTDHLTLRRLGRLLEQNGRRGEAADALRKAEASPALDRTSPSYVVLVWDAFRLNVSLERYTEAAGFGDKLAKVLASPAVYGLDEENWAFLFGKQRTSLYGMLAQVQLRARHYQQAMDMYRLADEASGVKGGLALQIANVRLAQGKLADAEAGCRRFLDDARNQDPAARYRGYQFLCRVLRRADRKDKLLEELEGAVKAHPDEGKLQHLLAEQYALLGRSGDAQRVYETLIARDPGAPAEAYRDLVALYRKHKQFTPLLVLLGRAYDSAQRRPQALLHLSAIGESRELCVRLAEAAKRLGKEQPASLTHGIAVCAGLLAEAGRCDRQAADFYRRAIQLDPTEAKTYEYLGLSLWRQRRYGTAADVFQKAVDAGHVQEDGRFRRLAARMLALDGQTDKAVRMLEALAAQRPKDPTTLSALAWAYANAGRTPQAIDRYERMLVKFPTGPVSLEARLHLAGILSDQDRRDEAEKHLLAALDEQPNHATANNNLGYLWVQQGRHLKRAEAMIGKALKAEPDNAAYLDSMGWALYRQNKVRSARRYLERASRQSADDPVIWDHLGDVYVRLQLHAKARHAWRRALKALDKQRHATRRRQIETKLRGLPAAPATRPAPQ